MTVYTIQKTAKWIKATQGIGWLLLILVLFNFEHHPHLAGELFFAAILVLAFARMAKWWNHG
jgi:hypothetical protein